MSSLLNANRLLFQRQSTVGREMTSSRDLLGSIGKAYFCVESAVDCCVEQTYHLFTLMTTALATRINLCRSYWHL